jgi:ubiquinone biosynthesis monooxygenase Coq7
MATSNSSPTARSASDRLLSGLEQALRGLAGAAAPKRPMPQPAAHADNAPLEPEARKLSAALMRVNHVGEICAQALYQAQALTTKDAQLREHFQHAAREEADHLAWTHQRLDELNDRISLLTPLWYAGAFGIGLAAGLAGDKLSLGFVVETERQVEEHLAGHLTRLPAKDHASRAVVAQMKADEAQHAQQALDAGAQLLPLPVKALMRLAAGVMTRTAHYI